MKTYHIGIKRIIRKYYEQLEVSKLDNRDEMRNFKKNLPKWTKNEIKIMNNSMIIK